MTHQNKWFGVATLIFLTFLLGFWLWKRPNTVPESPKPHSPTPSTTNSTVFGPPPLPPPPAPKAPVGSKPAPPNDQPLTLVTVDQLKTELKHNPHYPPMSLYHFATQITEHMKQAKTDPKKASQLFKFFEHCVKNAGIRTLKVLCLKNAGDLAGYGHTQPNWPNLQPEYETLQNHASQDTNHLVEALSSRN